MIEIKESAALEKYNLVIFFPCDWETPWRGHYLIKSLSERLKNSKILCVENPVDLVISLFKHPLRWIRQQNRKNHFRKVSDNLFTYRPRILLNVHVAARIPLAVRVNVKWLRDQLEHVMETSSFNKSTVITWVFDPFHESFVGMFDENLSIFDFYDEYTSVKGWPIFRAEREIRKHEKNLLQKVDITFVVSDALYRAKSPNAKKLYILPNAVDIKHFRPLDNDELADFKEMTEISRPIIGYLGGLSDKVDIPMLCSLADRHPEWSFVSIGRTPNKICKSLIFRRFIRNRNVHVVGFLPYEILPHYLNAFDVCFLPLLTDHPFNKKCAPLKIYEYLAIGKPIVSTDIPYVRKFRDVIRIGKDKDDIENHIRRCLKEKDSLKEKRIGVAKENTWERRVTEMLAIIADTIKKKNETYA